MDSIGSSLGIKSQTPAMGVGGVPDRKQVNEASKEIKQVIQSCMKELKAADETHTEILLGSTGNIAQLAQNLDKKVKDARQAVNNVKAAYGSYDDGKVQQLLLKANSRLEQLVKTQEQIKIWSTPQGQAVLEAKAGVNSLLGLSLKKKNDPIECLNQAREKLNQIKGMAAADPVLKAEVDRLETRLNHQADRELALSGKELQVAKNFKKGQGLAAAEPKVLESLVQKTLMRALITGQKDTAVWPAVAEAARRGGPSAALWSSAEANASLEAPATIQRGNFARFLTKDPAPSAAVLSNDMKKLAKDALKLEDQVRKLGDKMMANPSEAKGLQAKVLFEEIDAQITEQEERLKQCQDQLAELAVYKRYQGKIPALEARQADLIASIASLKSERAALETVATHVQGLDQHLRIQELLGALRKVGSDSKAEKTAGVTLLETHKAIQLLGRDHEFMALQQTLSHQLQALTNDATTLTDHKQNLLGRITGSNTELTSKNDFRRFGIILSKEAAAALFGPPEGVEAARDTVKALRRVMRDNSELKEYIEGDPKLMELMGTYDQKYNPLPLQTFRPPTVDSLPETLAAGMSAKQAIAYLELLTTERTYGSNMEMASRFIEEDDSDRGWKAVLNSEVGEPLNQQLLNQYEKAYKEAAELQNRIESKLANLQLHAQTPAIAQHVFNNSFRKTQTLLLMPRT